jgi:hypothetical protein
MAACSSVSEPRVAPCTAQNSAAVGTLGVGQYNSIVPSTDGCVIFGANSGSDTIEYVVVAQSVTSNPNRKADFRLAGEAMVLGPAPAVMSTLRTPVPTTVADQFHAFLRGEEAKSARLPVPPGAALATVRTPPPQIGEQRVFKVCSNVNSCTPMTTVTGVVVAVGQRLALYVDQTAQGSLTSTDYQEIATVFDQRLYPLDTLAFGTESDVDGNGVIMVLMTPAINRLVSAQTCMTAGYVAGYFFGLDIDPAQQFNPNFNKGEVFYTIVPDPSGQYSCTHTAQRVKEFVPVIFVHELQHMISFNWHVLKRNRTAAATEVLWLNEALSHYAEELGGRTYLPGDQATFSVYLSGNIRNAYSYMARPDSHFVIATFGSGTLGERGAGWLLMRYLVDQLANDSAMSSWHVATRQLVQTDTVGVANIEARTGVPIEQTLARWALALWVSDLPGFTAPPELRYRSWRFRTTYAGLYPATFDKPFPIDPPVAIGPDVDLVGTLRSGAGMYERVKQPAGAGAFTLQLAAPDGAPITSGLAPRLNVVRVR